MPEAFNKCVRNGGRVTTISVGGGGGSGNQYRHLCKDRGSGGKWHAGHVKTKKIGTGSSSPSAFPQRSSNKKLSIYKYHKR